MLKGFDKQTESLNDYERSILLPIFIRSLLRRNGKSNSVTSDYICKKMKELGYNVTPPRVRKIINHIRTNNLVPCLIATSEGYYIAETEQEAKDYLQSLEGRYMAIKQVYDSMRQQLSKKFGNNNQQQIFNFS